MEITPYLAMTAAEIRGNPLHSGKIAWMACHFSPYGTGLSNLPQSLPAGALLILNDRTPIHGHDPEQILLQLQQCADALQCRGVLLDLQRENCAESAQLVRYLLDNLDCPIAVSQGYEEGSDCPVFLPPVPVVTPPEAYLAPWQGREIWLDAAPAATGLVLTTCGCETVKVFGECSPSLPHRDEALNCHYKTEVLKDSIRFYLQRTWEDMCTLLRQAADLGVTNAVGLYQEWRKEKPP